MDITLLSSVNKLAIGFFIIMLVVLVVQFIIFFKKKKKVELVAVPEYTPEDVGILHATPISPKLLEINDEMTKTIKAELITFKEKAQNIQKRNKPHHYYPPFLATWLVLVISGVVVIYTTVMVNNLRRNLDLFTKENMLKEAIASTKISFFDTNWKPINKNELYASTQPKTIYLALPVDAIEEVSKVRIRVNSSTWLKDHESILYNKDLGVWYKEFTLGTEPGTLLIEAQVYINSIGWLE